MQDFLPWIHGAREIELFSFAANGNHHVGLGELSQHESQLLQALVDQNLTALKRLQLKRIYEWFGDPSATSSQDRDYHLQCWRKMLASLTSSRPWDVDGFKLVVESKPEGIHFGGFERELLKLDDAALRTVRCGDSREDNSDIRACLEIVSTFGYSIIVDLFSRLTLYCACPDCADARASILLVWNATRHRWTSGDWPSVELQRCAVTSPSATLFNLMRIDGCYCEANNHMDGFSALHFVRNEKICRELLREGRYDLERVIGDENKTALAFDAEWACGGHVSLALLQNGAKPQSILNARVIFPEALSSIDVTHPSFLRASMQQNVFLSKCTLPFVRHNRDAFLLARLVRKYISVLPLEIVRNLVTHAERQQSSGDFPEQPDASQILAAFFSFRLIDSKDVAVARVLERIPLCRRDQYFVWRWHTHKFCSREVQKRVITLTLALNKTLPPEIVNMILSRCTAQSKVEIDD